jgi:hypothetical protein
VNRHQPPAAIRRYQPAEQEHLGLLKTSIENSFASVDMGL